MSECVFCDKVEKKENIIFENELCVALLDEFPVNSGHMLVVSKRHAATYFDLTNKEKSKMLALLEKCKEFIDEKYKPDGYNVGLNCGFYAGQSIMHVHMHLIPRYKGDVENPRGGVRGVIPNKQNYQMEEKMERVYNKLVRDKIPEIIKGKGEEPITRILGDDEYKAELEKKLKEECTEVLGASGKDRVEELADVFEILKALAKLENSDIDEVSKIAEDKAAKRGAFKDKIFLEKVIEK